MSDETTHEPPANPEIHFEPIVSLPKMDIKSLEENEEEVFDIRAKLYRYDTHGDETEWKERGVGVLKILKHKARNIYRVLMRRDKTLKICANHLITPDMELKPNCGSDKAWVYSVVAEFADEECKAETLAVKFGNAENAKKFKDKFEECQKIISLSGDGTSAEQESDKLAKELQGLNVKDKKDNEGEEKKKDQTTDATTSNEKETQEKDEKRKEEEDVPEK